MARLPLAEVGLLLLLVLALLLIAEAGKKRSNTLRRKKREWILPPAKVMENIDYTSREFIAKIRSDKDIEETVEYFLSGPGADKPPYNLFVVDHNTGFVRIQGKVDRETHPFFKLVGLAKYLNGSLAETNIPLTITILDQNDNTPYFELHSGSINEDSKAGTFIMQIEGKDDDQPDTINSKISYSILSQEPAGTGHMFSIDKDTGKLYVKEPTLDRETHDFYTVVVQGADLGGAPGGLTGTGTVNIKVLDINDNIPTLEQSEYSGSVDENVHDVVVMKIKALDDDLIHTDNWLTVFTLVKGNEDNLFSIETDKETNEGILRLIKPVDFEEVKNLELGLLIENVAPFVDGNAIEMDVGVKVGEGDPLGVGAGAGAGAGGGVGVGVGVDVGVHVGVDLDLDAGVEGGLGPGGGAGLDAALAPDVHPGAVTKPKPSTPAKSYPIMIAVNNMPEGPAFIPDTKNVPVSEDPNDQPEDGVITVFPAIDPDTGQPAEDVSYAKAFDPDNWLTIDEETAEIKLNKVPDRESPFLVNGTYIAKVLAITKDMPAKTATGTIAIKVTDSNDHCPTLATTHTSLCADEKTVYVTGFDEDGSPNAAPFTFTIIPEGTRGSWDVEVINDTSAAFHSHDNMWPGVYELQVKVSDAQGLSCPANEVFTVQVCTCEGDEDCSVRVAKLVTTSSELSATAIGLLLLAMCLLLLIPLLLLFCQCAGANTIFPDKFSDLPFDAKEHLISYHTEGRGEDKEVPLQSIPIMLGTQKNVEMGAAQNFNAAPSKITESHQMTSFYNESSQNFTTETDNTFKFSRESFNHGTLRGSFSRQTLGAQHPAAIFDDMALPDSFLHDYYSQKAGCAVLVKDGLLGYDYEGLGSPAGSVGCCSLLESDNDLQFLNDLGPKFKTLAEICLPPASTPNSSMTHIVTGEVKTTSDAAEPVVKPKVEQSVEIKHTDIKTEKVMSSTNISKSSMTLPHSKVTNISLSSNISQSATLPRQAQTVVLQKQPVYYTTSPVLQPIHYVVQPQLQNMVLLTNGTHGGNFPGMYVVNGPPSPPSGLVVSGTKSPPSGLIVRGPQSPPSGLIVSGPQISPSGLIVSGPQSPPSGLIVSGPQSPTSGLVVSGPRVSSSRLVVQRTESAKNHASPTSPVSPTLLLPVSPGVSQGSVPVEGWKMIGPNPDGTCMLVKDKSSPGETERVGPGSSPGSLPRDASPVKEAAPPQGVLGPAAQGSVHAVVPGHTVVAVNRNLEQTQVGQPGQMGLGLVNVGQPMAMGHVVAMKPEVSQAGISPDIKYVNVNQFQQTADASGILNASGTDLPKEDEIIDIVQTVITAENILPGSDATDVVNTDEKNEDTSTSSQGKEDTSISDHINIVEDPIYSTEETIGRQEAALLKHEVLEEIKPVQPSTVEGPEIRSSEFGSEPGSDKVPEDQSGGELDEDVSSADEVASDLKGNEIIGTFESIQPEESMEEMTAVTRYAQGKVEAEQLVEPDVGLHTVDDELPATPPNEISTETVSESEERSIPDQESVPDLQVSASEGNEIDEGHAITNFTDAEASLQTETTTLTNREKGDVDDPNLISASDEIIQEKVEGSAEQNLHTATDSGHKEEDVDDQPNPTAGLGVDKKQGESDEDNISDGEEEEIIVQKVVSHQSFSASDDLDVDAEKQDALSTSSQMEENFISDGSITDEERAKVAMEEVVSQPSQNVGFSAQKDQESETEDASSSQMEENFISDGSITDEERAEAAMEEVVSQPSQNVGFSAQTDQESETEDASSSQMEENFISDGSITDEERAEAAMEEVVSQPSQNVGFSAQTDQESETEDASSSQMEENFISDGSITDEERAEAAMEEVVSQPSQNVGFSAQKDQESETEDASRSQGDDIFMSDNEKENVEEVELPLHQTVNITDDQKEDRGIEAASGRSSPNEAQLMSEDNMRDRAKEEEVEEEMLPVQ